MSIQIIRPAEYLRSQASIVRCTSPDLDHTSGAPHCTAMQHFWSFQAMKRLALAALFASLTLATAAPAFADDYDDAVAAQISKYLSYPEMAVNQQVEGRVGVRLQ